MVVRSFNMHDLETVTPAKAQESELKMLRLS